MSLSPLSRRLLMSLPVVVLATAGTGQLAGGTTAQLWLPLLVGALTATAAALFVLRPLASDAEDSRRTPAADVESTRDNHSPAEAQQNAALLETVLGTMVEGVIVVNSQERMLYANRAARSLLDIQQRDVVGRPVLEAARSSDIDQAVQAALRSGQTQHSEFEFPRKQRFVALTVSVLPGDPLPGVVLVIHDVTELRRLERLRRDFVSNVSHELKTPLTSIQAYADTLIEGAVDDPAHNRVFLQRIVEQAERLQSLIQDLLRLAKIESQTEAFRIEPVSLARLAAECVDDYRPIAETKGLALETADVADVVVQADVDGLRQILDNLVNNALNYTPAGGRVNVRVRRQEGWGVLEVEDTGIGIAKDEQARVFERFYRVDRARSRAVGGTGLGLAIVKHLAQSFSGRVELTSELGRGSRFVVWLPAAEGTTTPVDASHAETMG